MQNMESVAHKMDSLVLKNKVWGIREDICDPLTKVENIILFFLKHFTLKVRNYPLLTLFSFPDLN